MSCTALCRIICGVAGSLIESIQPSCRRARHSLPTDPNISRPPLSAISILSPDRRTLTDGGYRRQISRLDSVKTARARATTGCSAGARDNDGQW